MIIPKIWEKMFQTTNQFQSAKIQPGQFSKEWEHSENNLQNSRPQKGIYNL